MDDNKTLKQLYQEQLDFYPKLSQEEIVSLYEGEKITTETFKELNRKTDIKRNDSWQKKYLKLKQTYKTHSHKFYVSTRGVIPKDRIFPSNELRNEIVCGTLGVAKYWAGIYFHKVDNTVPFDDLLQVAREALISAAHYYIPSDRAKFTTYASRCIENKLKKEVYARKQLKKRPYKPNDFFQKEKDKIKYIKMFLESTKTKSRSGKTTYYSENYVETISVMLFRFKKQIRCHNTQANLREENRRLFPSYSGIGTQEKLEVITNRIIQMINESKIKTLITNEDRELSSMLVNYKNGSKDTQEIYQLIDYLEWYLYKLNLIENYFKVEKELMVKNDDITPTDAEILEELNKKIKLDNQEIYKLKKEGALKKSNSYKFLYDYYNEYKDVYKVDPFISPEDYEIDSLSSKKKERDDIAYEFEEDERIYNLEHMIKSIRYSRSEKVVLFFSDDELQRYDDWEEFEEETEYENADIFLKEEALESLRTIIDSIPKLTEKEYVTMILQQRKETINAILKEKNTPIIEHNREVAKLEEKLNLGNKYKRHLKDNQIVEIKNNIELLFGDDSELLILMNSGRSKDKWHRFNYLSVEDEALNNIFLEDYYKALRKLPKLESQVLLKYFDENGVHSMKAKEISAELDITEKQVYKIKTKALKRLSKDDKLKSYKEEL